MLQVLNIALRWLVGLLFIVSGLVKVNDPAGLSYKMQEFFEVWGWHGLHDYTLWLAIVMNIFEVVAGDLSNSLQVYRRSSNSDSSKMHIFGHPVFSSTNEPLTGT